MAIMEGNSESSQQPKAENVKIIIDDQFQLMKNNFSQYIDEVQKPVVAFNYRVPDNLRKGHEDAHTPRVVSIGPIHYGKPHLQAMERSKRMFLAWYLERSSALSLDDMVQVAIDIENEARMSYLEKFDNISSREFSEMIILDFIFLSESFFLYNFQNERTLPFATPVIADIITDTVLLENQFPQKLVTHLFHLLYMEHNLGDLILKYFWWTGLVESLNASPYDWSSATDMLDFLVTCHVGKIEDTTHGEIQRTWLGSTRSATELREAGVKFSKVVGAAFLLDVKFVNGVLKMPVIKINNGFETPFRSMITYEQSRHDKPKRVSGYIMMMTILIKSPKDVALLSKCGIIEHPHHDYEQVIRLFGNVATQVAIDKSKCYFWGLYMKMDVYSRNNCHQWKGSWFKWKRMLREDYFCSPWSIISFIAAFILLVLTVIQTAYSIKQK
ncbi:hypothetical protein LguiB_027681 [Lonicera macranthoides]